MAKQDRSRRSNCVSVPNIRDEALPWYLAVFTAITVYLTVSNTIFLVVSEQIAGWQAVQYATTGELLKAGGVALIASPIIVEGGRMVLAAIWTERRLREAREALRNNQARWEAWNQRRQEAEVKGIPFDEPPPELKNQQESSR